MGGVRMNNNVKIISIVLLAALVTVTAGVLCGIGQVAAEAALAAIMGALSTVAALFVKSDKPS